MKRIEKLLALTGFIILLLAGTTALAKTNYIYRSRANWVKLNKLSNKQLAGQTLSHPYTAITIDQMTSMLASLNLNKKKLFKGKEAEEFKTTEIFSTLEAKKYAPLLVQALNEATPNEIVNMAIVHKRPYFVLRNDYISIINVYAKEDGVHFNFSKMFARLNGDYQQASRVDESIRKAKSVRVSLDAGAGQILVGDGSEIVLSPSFDYGTNQALAVVTTETSQPQANTQTTAATVPASTKNAKTTVAVAPEPVSSTSASDVQSRLQKLEELKKSKLISTAEYNQKRAEILSQL